MASSLPTRGFNLNINHVAVSVPDCVAASKWYMEVFGFRKLCPEMLISREKDPTHVIFRVYGAKLQEVKLVYLSAGNGVGFEIFQFIDPPYVGPSGPTDNDFSDGTQWTAGRFFHIAVTAPEPMVLCQKVVEAGGKQLGEPIKAGTREMAVYLQDPWGNAIEIVSCAWESVILGASVPE